MTFTTFQAAGRHRSLPAGSAAGTARFRFVLFRSRGRSTAHSTLVRSRPAPPLLIRLSRIVVTVIAAMRTFTAQLVKWETGRPLRLAAPDAVQPLKAAVVPHERCDYPRRALPSDNRSGWHRAGRGPQRGSRVGVPRRPTWRAGVSREHCFSPSTRWGCSVTGPGPLCRISNVAADAVQPRSTDGRDRCNRDFDA